ncbi:MAG: TetR/AcrR family transcriptional regulator [Thermodesulfobacteriota bacterium]|nr:TetR/AcrR family transcriptional regulator [Thermodesulfobacteriota bacterium]
MTKETKRNLILNAAIKVFAQRGYYGSRVSDITEEAGIAYGLVYRYFRSKDDVLISIFEDRWSRYLKMIEKIDRDFFDPRDKLSSVIQYIFKSYQQNPDMMKVLIMDTPRLDKFYEEDNQRLYNQVFEKIASIVKEGQDKEIFRKALSPILGAYIFHGAVDAVIRQYVYNLDELEKREISVNDARDHIVDFIVKAFTISGEDKD